MVVYIVFYIFFTYKFSFNINIYYYEDDYLFLKL